MCVYVCVYVCVTLYLYVYVLGSQQGGKNFFLSGNMGQRLEIFLGWFSYAHASQWLSVTYHVYEL